MLAEVPVPFSIADVLATDVAHLVSTDTREFVATRRLDERCIAARTCSFDSQRHSQLNLSAKSHERRFVADMNIVPGLGTGYAGGSSAMFALADKLEAEASPA